VSQTAFAHDLASTDLSMVGDILTPRTRASLRSANTSLPAFRPHQHNTPVTTGSHDPAPRSRRDHFRDHYPAEPPYVGLLSLPLHQAAHAANPSPDLALSTSHYLGLGGMMHRNENSSSVRFSN